MFTKFLLIQKLEQDGNAKFHLIKSDYLQWTFENRRTQIESDSVIFPFVVLSEDIKIQSHPPQPETKIYVRENEITFADDYAVPEGFTIGILFPENYIPTVLKFKDKPVIPIGLQGQFVANAQGQFQILYNRIAKRSAIIFNIHQNVCFGFKCIARKVTDENFPQNESITADDFFDVIIDTEFLKIDAITNDDLKIINKTLEATDLDDVKNAINEVLLALKSGDKKEAKSLLDKLGKYVLNGISLTGNLTKIIDSYNEDGAPQQFIAKLLEYLNL
ncbi:hypothetical protein [Flavobacterium sp. AED]|uniref:hypothetical protein n=1 Tax=Flavobacterium sp. AED TaxID=1423323 RepID=UPI00057D03C1|nr:hypothetical protein [Flavobacterium sp. AED]KIA86483.1 hypothetical protein OA85_02100 [Flavobacterium sp. AED]